MDGLILLAWIIGLAVVFFAWRVAVWINEAPVMAGEYSHLDTLDGLPHDGLSPEHIAHEQRMDALAAERGYVR